MSGGEQPYPVVATKVDLRSEEFQANATANTAAVAKLRAALGEAILGGGEKYTSVMSPPENTHRAERDAPIATIRRRAPARAVAKSPAMAPFTPADRSRFLSKLDELISRGIREP